MTWLRIDYSELGMDLNNHLTPCFLSNRTSHHFIMLQVYCMGVHAIFWPLVDPMGARAPPSWPTMWPSVLPPLTCPKGCTRVALPLAELPICPHGRCVDGVTMIAGHFNGGERPRNNVVLAVAGAGFCYMFNEYACRTKTMLTDTVHLRFSTFF